MDSLKKFEKLEALEVQIAVLLGWSAGFSERLSGILFPNLSTLILKDDLVFIWKSEWYDDAVVPKVKEFLKDRSENSILTSLRLTIKHCTSSLLQNPS